jgi:adenine-specific DNA-methyltransferase
MKTLTDQDPETKSPDLVADNIEHLKAIFPEAFTEGKIDFDVLKQLLGGGGGGGGGGAADEREEKFGLNWHGKRLARQLALTPSTGTLRPCPEDSVDWDTTRNLMIEGDNLEVLKLLQKSYAGKVKLIYIDPPYNTGKDFVYPDDFQDNIKNYLMRTGQMESDGRKNSSNTEASGRFHTDWLNMMYPRIKLARNLLREDGVMFVSIDENEECNLRALLNEVFGEENAVVGVVWEKRVSPANDAKWFSSDHDLILVYAKNKEAWQPRRLGRNEEQLAYYKNPDNDPRGPWNSATYTCNKTKEERPNLYYPITNPHSGEEVWPKETAVWKYGQDVTAQYIKEKRLYWGANGGASFPRIKLFLSEMENVVPRSVWSYEDAGHTQEATGELKALFDGKQVFDSPKPVRLIRRMIEVSGADEGDYVLDFFAGSATTGHAVMEGAAAGANSVRFILVQLPEPTQNPEYPTIAEIAKERLRRAAKKIREKDPMFAGDLGFRVFKLDSSNIRAWEPSRENLAATLEEHVEHLKTNRTESDILFELLLKLGLDLTVPIEQKCIAGKTVHSIGAGTLLVCLSDKIAATEVEPLALGIVAWHKAQAPVGDSTVVFRDSAFADDVAKTNLTAILQQNGLENVRSL